MDRQGEKRRYAINEVQGAIVAVVILAAATTPLVLSYKDRRQSSPKPTEPTPAKIDIEAAKRRTIFGQENPKPSPSPSPYISFD